MADTHFPMVKIDGPDDPERCHGTMKNGQCGHKNTGVSVFCPMHGGAHQVKSAQRKEMNMYNLQKYQERMAQFAEHPKVKSLRDELGITRMTLEKIITKCDNDNDLICYQPQIMQMVSTIKGLVEVTQKLEEKDNMLLDKGVILNIADTIVRVVGTYVTDPAILGKIGEEICGVIEKSVSSSNSSRLSKT